MIRENGKGVSTDCFTWFRMHQEEAWADQKISTWYLKNTARQRPLYQTEWEMANHRTHRR